jgi:hypothetical protein
MVKLRILFLISCLMLTGLPRTVAHAQSTVTFVNCSGTNDTAAFQAIITAIGAATGTINIPFKASTANRCAVNNLTIPANVTINNQNGIGIKVNTGQTLTVLGPVDAPVGKTTFFGPGTTSFAGNTVVGTSGQALTADGTGGTAYTTIISGVSSVFGRTGAVVAATNDYTFAQINKTTSSLADLTTRSASDLSSGTLPDARFPATLPAVSGANLTNLNASNLSSGTVPDARFPATLPAISGANLTNLNASNLASGTVPDARFPSTLPAVSGVNLTNLNASNLASGTVPDARFPSTLPAISGTNLTNLNGTNISSGTVDIARLPATLIRGSVGSTDNGIPRADGTGGVTVQGSATAVITDAGNMGIGTTDPIFNDDGSTGANIGRWLAVDGTAAGSGFAAYFGVGGTIPGVNDRVGALNFFNYSMGGVDNRTASIFSFNDGALGRGNLQFNTSASNLGPETRMEISYTGEVGIGHTASRLSNVRLQVGGMGATNSTYSLLLYNNADLPNFWFADGGKVFFATSDVNSVIAPYSGGIFHVGTTGQFTAFANGDVLAKNYRSLQPTPPTCTSNCGTSPAIVGSDSVMRVTMGSGGSPASGWVVTFNGTWAAAPACTGSSALSSMVVGKMPIALQTSTTTVTVTTNGTAPGNNDVYSIICMGVQ